MDAYGIIILNKIGNNVTLYINSLKKGYYILCCTRAAIDREAMILQWPEAKLLELNPGKYYIYCINDNSETDGDIQIDIGYDTEQEQLEKVLISNGLNMSPYINIIKTIKTVDYIVELYDQYQASEDNDAYHKLLSVLVSDYNAKQEDLNYFKEPLFLIDYKTEHISSYRQQLYTFILYKYDTSTHRWQIIQNQVIKDSSVFNISGVPHGLYKIVITINGILVRSFYWYESPADIKEKAIQEQIVLRRIATEKGKELVGSIQNENLDRSAYETIAAIVDFDIQSPVLRKPEIELDQYIMTVTIPDYNLILSSKTSCYLALLEKEEIYSDKRNPHRILITSSSFQINALQYLPNSDTEYIAYIIDNNGMVLSQATFISFDPEYPITEYTNAYCKIEFDRYIRKLYTLFKEYDANEWDAISLISDRYFLQENNATSFSNFILTQLSYLDPNRYNIGLMMQIVLLCDLKYFTNIDQSLAANQVYAIPYKTHIFPRSNSGYIICAIYMNDGELSYQYYKSGNSGTEIRIDRGDIVILQAINPRTWQKSSIAFYNNKYPGAPYFYFPELEVEVKHGLY